MAVDVDFLKAIDNYEDSLRGRIKENGEYIHVYPEVAGSVFISKTISSLKSLFIKEGNLSNLKEETCKTRILTNASAFVCDMIDDETVPISSMERLGTNFENFLVDGYLGLRNGGHFSELSRDVNEERIDDDRGFA